MQTAKEKWSSLDQPLKQHHLDVFSLQIGRTSVLPVGTSGTPSSQLQSILDEICLQDQQSAQSLLE